MNTYRILILSLALILPWQPVTAAAVSARHVCAHVPAAGAARCQASVLTDSSGHAVVSGSPKGYGPSAFHGAYRAPSRAARATTLAVVTAYDAPHIKADLDVYDRAFGLPAFPACTYSGQTSCFSKVNQTGSSNWPTPNSGWAVETSLDVEEAHAMCQNCRLVLVEANSPSLADLGAAVDQAVAQGARVVSNSYGGAEFAGEAEYDAHYHHSGVTVVVSSGDKGYGVTYPAASPYVVAVGGTTLSLSGAQLQSETAWDKSGSGCSSYEVKPSWQHDTSCSRRTVADIAADANPATGAAVYDSFANGSRAGWLTVGGTSLAAPLVAGMLATSGFPAGTGASSLYSQGGLRDIIGGKTGRCRSYLCQGVTGYDGPTGLGAPSGW